MDKTKKNTFYRKYFYFQYPQSNVRTILEKVAKLVKEISSPKELMAKYIYEDPEDNGYVKERVFR